MDKQIKLLKAKFGEIKKMGWIESKTDDRSGIGLTFESLLNIPVNEFEIPDFGNIELKTKTKGTSINSFITLFSCVPAGPHYHEVERLKNLYGYNDLILKQYKVLNIATYCNKLTNTISGYFFKLRINYTNNKINLLIYNNKKELIEDSVYWDFDIIKEKLIRKMKCLAVIKAEKRFIHNKKQFKYYAMKIYKLKGFDVFLRLIELGIVRISFQISVYRWGQKIGMVHDRGTIFAINEKNIDKLYSIIDEVI